MTPPSCSSGTTSRVALANVCRRQLADERRAPGRRRDRAAEALEIEARRFSTDLHLDHAGLRAAGLASTGRRLDAGARAGAASDALRGFRRAGRRPRRRDPGAAPRAQPRGRASCPRPSRAASATAGARRPVPRRRARRVCPRTTCRAPGRRAGSGRDQHGVPRHAPVPDPRPRPASRGVPWRTAFLNIGWPDNDPVLAELLDVRDGEGHPAGVRRLAELRRRGQDDRRAAPASPSSSTRSPPPSERPDAATSRCCWSRPRPRARTSSTSPTGATTPRPSSASGTASTPRRCAATSTSPRCARACSTSPAGSSASRYEQVDAPDLARRGHVVRRAAGRERPAARPDPPRPAPARRASSTTPRSSPSSPACCGRQLPEGVLVCNFSRGLMEPRRRGHAVPRVRPPDAPRARRPPRVGALLRGRHRVGLRRGAVADARGVGLGRRTCCAASPPTPTARRSPRTSSPRMRAADEFGKGFLARTQMVYAAISYWFHQERPDDLDRPAARA